MYLSQTAILVLFAASFLAGVLVAFLGDVFYMLRLPLLPQGNRYTVTAILRAMRKRMEKGCKKPSKWLSVAVFLGDVFLCLTGAIALILILYGFNNGVFRAVAPLSFGAGVAVWHFCFSKWARILLQWFAFGIETFIYMLLWPIRRFFTWVIKFLKASIRKRCMIAWQKQRAHKTSIELQNIDATAQTLLCFLTKSRMQKGDTNARKNKFKKAV